MLETLKKHIQDVIDLSGLLDMTGVAQLQKASVRKLQERLDKKQAEIDRCQTLLRKLYESLADGIIDRDEYQDLKKTYIRRREEAEEQVKAIIEEMTRQTEDDTEGRSWMGQFRKHRNITDLDRSIVVTLIERILIYREGRVEIVFRWHNEFNRYMELLTQALSIKEAV